jgi:uncharacterized metal-binding protein
MGIEKLPLFLRGSYVLGALSFSLMSTVLYVWCSYFFQPDLDVRTNRPGMNTFPIGAILLNSHFSFLLIPVQFAMGKPWYYFWQIYAYFCTHRGVSHWPIISTWYRTGYIWIWIFILKSVFSVFHINHVPLLPYVEYWTRSFFPFQKGFGTMTWFCFCFPVFICDIAHEVIDFYDSKRKGLSYCVPQHPRGLFTQIYLFLKEFFGKKRA